MDGMMGTLRSRTSRQMASIMRKSSAQPHRAAASSSRPYRASRRAIFIAPGAALTSLTSRQQRAQLRRKLRARLQLRRPAHLVGEGEILLRLLVVEADGLDAGLGLAFRLVGGELLPFDIARLQRQHLPLQELALLVRQPLPQVEIEHHGNLGVVEPRVDAVFRVLLPVEVEDAADGPAVAVD